MKSKKLLIVVNEAWFFNSHRLSFALYAKQNGYDVHIAANGDEISELRIIESGLKFHNIPFKRSSTNIFVELFTLLKLIRLYINIKPVIVHHVTIKPIVYGSIAARLSSIPFVVNAISGLGFVFINTGFFASIRKNLISYFYKYMFNQNNVRVIFQNPDERNLLLNKNIVSKQYSSLIKGAGVNLDEFAPNFNLKEEVPTIVLSARMIWDKGIKEFVNAALILKERGAKAKFILVGAIDYDYPRFVEEEILQEWTNKGIVTWLGYRDNISEIYQKSSIVCMPSFYSEGIPKSLIEAAACGKPIVTTNMPGCREIVKNNFNGILVEPRDEKSLANALEILINDFDLRLEYGLNGRRMAEEEFGIERINRMTLNVYESLIN
jgi:glycosyltransferase involved in cell wall biosynthesis